MSPRAVSRTLGLSSTGGWTRGTPTLHNLFVCETSTESRITSRDSSDATEKRARLAVRPPFPTGSTNSAPAPDFRDFGSCACSLRWCVTNHGSRANSRHGTGCVPGWQSGSVFCKSNVGAPLRFPYSGAHESRFARGCCGGAARAANVRFWARCQAPCTTLWAALGARLHAICRRHGRVPHSDEREGRSQKRPYRLSIAISPGAGLPSAGARVLGVGWRCEGNVPNP